MYPFYTGFNPPVPRGRARGFSDLRFWTVLASLALCVIFFVWLAIVIFARSTEADDAEPNEPPEPPALRVAGVQ